MLRAPATDEAQARKEARLQHKALIGSINRSMSDIVASGEQYYHHTLDFNKCLRKARDPQGLNIWALGRLSVAIFEGAQAYINAAQRFTLNISRGFLNHEVARTRFAAQIEDVSTVPEDLQAKWEALARALGCSPKDIEFALSLEDDSDRARYLKIKKANPMFCDALVQGKRKVDELANQVDELTDALECRMRTK
jgi:hypothetical protein